MTPRVATTQAAPKHPVEPREAPSLPWDIVGAEAGLSPASRPGRAIQGGPRNLLRISPADPASPGKPYELFEVIPLSPLVGAEIRGVDLGAALDAALRDELNRA